MVCIGWSFSPGMFLTSGISLVQVQPIKTGWLCPILCGEMFAWIICLFEKSGWSGGVMVLGKLPVPAASS